MERAEAVEKYMDNFFYSYEGEAGVKCLEELCETLGYGEGFMRGRAIEEMFTDNPGALQAVAEFLKSWAVRSPMWAKRMEDVLEEQGLTTWGDDEED